jgi:hypothetical protein
MGFALLGGPLSGDELPLTPHASSRRAVIYRYYLGRRTLRLSYYGTQTFPDMTSIAWSFSAVA